ncbi:hypothetical protein D3C75_1116950 [compost metagenome]
MKEQQVQCEIPAANLKRILRADEAEVPAQFAQELFEPLHQCAMQVSFSMVPRQAKELDHVGISENIHGRRIILPQRR